MVREENGRAAKELRIRLFSEHRWRDLSVFPWEQPRTRYNNRVRCFRFKRCSRLWSFISDFSAFLLFFFFFFFLWEFNNRNLLKERDFFKEIYIYNNSRRKLNKKNSKTLLQINKIFFISSHEKDYFSN